MKIFHIQNIDLEGKNLVEASAGTGKTYAIGILVLRLLLEKNIKIEQILMVTYTNAAVDELEMRIRKFINEALLYTRKILITENKQIEYVVDKSIKKIGTENTLRLLNEAVEFLDETSIFTIHGFCKRVLTEYAFENSMLLNTEIIDDQSYMIENAIAQYWRKNITSINPDLLTLILDKDFSQKNIMEIFYKLANGSTLKIKNQIDNSDILSLFKAIKSNLDKEIEKLKTKIENSWAIIDNAKIGKLRKLNQALKDRKSEDFVNEFIIKLKTTPESNDLLKIDFLFTLGEQIINLQEELSDFIDDVMSIKLLEAVKFIDSRIEQKKKRNKLLSFYDLIKILHDTVVIKGKVDLKRELNFKYRAVFIDEFQDTDILQYEIFSKLFIENSNSILFFIGDPKQSIYSFRGADLDTYNSAKENLKNSLYSMNTNFRSTEKLLIGINEFFQTNSSSNNLNYSEVLFGNDSLGELYKGENIDNSFEIINNIDQESGISHNQDQIIDSMSNEIIEILKKGRFYKKNKFRSITPSDIGILVRNKSHGKSIKEKLSEFNIPAIIVDDTKVIETDEARQLFYILMAILDPIDSHIRRALLTTFTGFIPEQIKNLDIDVTRDIFIQIKNTWNSSGVYTAISEYIKYFNVKTNLIFTNNTRGNRIFTNMMQLSEILNEKEVYEGYSPVQITDWLLRARQGDKNVSKYEQLLESDDNSIQIVTVHKSKGLAYNIVVLPVFNLTINENKHFSTEYKNSEGQKIVSIYKDAEENEFRRIQEQHENERLLYVAITRAVYKCIIHYNHNEGILKDFIQSIPHDSDAIKFRSADNTKKSYSYNQVIKDKNIFKPEVFNSQIYDSWKVTSYSALSNNKEYVSKLNEKITSFSNDYDEFIFNKLEKGVKTGLIVHSIMEKIDFSDATFHENIIKIKMNEFGQNLIEEDLSPYLIMVQNILQSTLYPLNFKLSDINYKSKITELEFYFSIDKFKTNKLKSIFPHLNTNISELEGVMHGFIDLVFQIDNKYYILDWKTNHLGSKIEDYSLQNLEEEIKDDLYDLQYHIYIIALIRYLKSRINDFEYNRDFGGVFYLFIRGIRKNSNSGIFYDKPNFELIQELEELI